MKPLSALLPKIDASRPAASPRAYLVALILLAILPIAFLMAYWLISDSEGQRQRLQLELQQSANALAQIVDRELAFSIDTLTMLANTESIQHHHLAAFEKSLHGPRAPLSRHWQGTYLLDKDGNRLFETGSTQPARRPASQTATPPPFPSPLPAAAAIPPARISDRLADHGPEQGTIAIEVPVTVDGKLRYQLGAWIGAGVWLDLLQQAGLPAGSVAGLYDRGHRPIVRSAAPAAPAGKPEAAYAAGQTVALAGWTVDVRVPASAYDTRRRQATGDALAIAVLCLLTGVLLALLMARRLTHWLDPLAADLHDAPEAMVDISELKRAEAHLADAEKNLRESQLLIELAQEVGLGFFHYRFASDVLAWSPGLCRLFGMAAEARESTLAQFLSQVASDHRRRIDHVLSDAYASGREKETLEFRVILPDGAKRWLACRIMISYGDDGRPAQMIAVSLDITDQKEAEYGRSALTEREHAVRIEAEASNRAKDEFLAMLGHELRNPLSAITAAIEVLNHVDADAEAARSARHVIVRQTGHLARLMDDLLDVARVISGKILLSRQPINLVPLVNRLVATAQLTGSTDRHQLQLVLDEVWIDADATRIEQVVNNLLTNALKYTPAGGHIDVRVGRDGDQAVLEVSDTGLGIHPTLLPKIFDLFVQAERTLDRRAGGLGIGLTLIRRLVELHGGTVGAVSSTAGTVFTVRLPAIEAPAATAVHERLPPSRRRRIGIIEDNDDARDSLRQMLELDGHAVWCENDGIGGLAALLDKRPDVAVVDIGLPGLTGFEVAKRSRAAGYGGRLIALSGYCQDNFGAQSMAAGFDAYLIKPVNADQLRGILSED